MAPEQFWPWRIHQGETADLQLTWRDKSTREPLSVAGCSALLEIRSSAGGQLYHRMTSANGGGITLGGTAGTIRLTIPADTTKTWLWETAVYELWLTFANGHRKPFLSGTITVRRAVATGE